MCWLLEQVDAQEQQDHALQPLREEVQAAAAAAAASVASGTEFSLDATGAVATLTEPSRQYFRKWYAVRFVDGGQPAVYNNWPDAEAAVKGSPYAEHRSFQDYAEAVAYAFGPEHMHRVPMPEVAEPEEEPAPLQVQVQPPPQQQGWPALASSSSRALGHMATALATAAGAGAPAAAHASARQVVGALEDVFCMPPPTPEMFSVALASGGVTRQGGGTQRVLASGDVTNSSSFTSFTSSSSSSPAFMDPLWPQRPQQQQQQQRVGAEAGARTAAEQGPSAEAAGGPGPQWLVGRVEEPADPGVMGRGAAAHELPPAPAVSTAEAAGTAAPEAVLLGRMRVAGVATRLAAEWVPCMSPGGLRQLVQDAEAERLRLLARAAGGGGVGGPVHPARPASGCTSPHALANAAAAARRAACIGAHSAALLQQLYDRTGTASVSASSSSSSNSTSGGTGTARSGGNSTAAGGCLAAVAAGLQRDSGSDARHIFKFGSRAYRRLRQRLPRRQAELQMRRGPVPART
eukprot:XP_001693398.1 predicted protein [Chlamydomonas reinhardtii]